MNPFDIRQHVEFNSQGRAICPSCTFSKGANHKKLNLSLIPNTDSAYKCHRGCTSDEIRDALGVQRNRVIPTAIAQSATPIAKVTVAPQKVKEAYETLIESDGAAKKWLHERGIDDEMITRYWLGIARTKTGGKHLPSISIPIPNHDGTQYYQKKRVAPWLDDAEKEKLLGEDWQTDWRDWSQYGIPARVYFTWLPSEATETYLCEGEWDAMMLGWAMRQADKPIAVACFTCGCGNVPSEEQLALLPGTVYVFYDRQDKPSPSGKIPGDEGAKKVAAALGDRGRIALVPMPENCDRPGWDVSDAINHGYQVEDFNQAAALSVNLAETVESPTIKPKFNPLRERLVWNDALIESAPDYTEWLADELLTTNELFLVAAGPRMGKSLLAMTLAHSVATGMPFLGRPVLQGTVLYVCLEDGPAKLKEREAAQGWSKGLPVVWLNKFKLSEIAYLREIAEELDTRLIVIDTLSRVKDGNISESSAEMSQVLEPLQEMAGELETCILLVHHTGKVNVDNASQIDIFDTIRGSSAIRAVCRGSMVIAATDRDYRLVVENGWGKHDLRVVLDANTLTWKLLGQWNPVENASQSDQIFEYLKKVQCASLEQIHEGTGIPIKSLYQQLSRLQISKSAERKVVKKGTRRKYTYQLALFNSIQLLNSVLNSENPNSESDTGCYSTKDILCQVDEAPKSDQTTHTKDDHATSTTKFGHKPDQCSKPASAENHSVFGTRDVPNGLKPLPSKGSEKIDHFGYSTESALGVEYKNIEAQNQATDASQPIQHLFNNCHSVEYRINDHPSDVVRESHQFETKSDHFEDKPDQLPDPYIRPASPIDPKRVALEIGDKVEILKGFLTGRRVFVVEFHPSGLIGVKNNSSNVVQKFPRSDLRLLKRASD